VASATRIGLAGIELIRVRPRAVLAWGFVYLLFGIVVSLLTRPMVERMLLSMPRAGNVAPARAQAWDMIGPIIVANLGMLGMMLVLVAAAMRAVLRPAEQGAFFIRVGMDELRLVGAITLVWLIMLGVYILTILAIAILAGVVGFAAGAAGMRRAGIAVGLMLMIVSEFALLLAIQTRLALALPLTLLRGRIVAREAWTRSKGHFWPLFGGSLLSGLVLMVALAMLSLPLLLTYLSDGGISAALADPQRQIAAMHSPLAYAMWLLTPLLGGFMVAMLGGALGTAVLETEPAA
jgi:hypothetical protein